MTRYKKIGSRFEYLFSAGGSAGVDFIIVRRIAGQLVPGRYNVTHVTPYNSSLAPEGGQDFREAAGGTLYASDGLALAKLEPRSDYDPALLPNPEEGVYEIFADSGSGDQDGPTSTEIEYEGQTFNSWEEVRAHLSEGRVVLWSLQDAQRFALFTYRGVKYVAPAKIVNEIQQPTGHLTFLDSYETPGAATRLEESPSLNYEVGVRQVYPDLGNFQIKLGTHRRIAAGVHLISYDRLDDKLIGYVYALGGQEAVDKQLVPSLWPIHSKVFNSLDKAVVNVGVNSGGYALTRLTGHVLIEDPNLIIPASGTYVNPVDGKSYVSSDAFDSSPQDRLFVGWSGLNHQRVNAQTMLHPDACIVRLKDVGHPVAIVGKARAATLLRGSDETPYSILRVDGTESPVTNGRAIANILASIALSTPELASKITLDGVYASASPAYLLAATSRPSVSLANNTLYGSQATVDAVGALLRGLTAKTISVTDSAGLDLSVVTAPAPSDGDSGGVASGLVALVKASTDPTALSRALESMIRDRAPVERKYAVSPLTVDRYSDIPGYSQDVTSPFYKLVSGVLNGTISVTNTMGHPSAKQVVTTAPYDPRYLALFSGIVDGTIRVTDTAGSPARGVTLAYALRKYDDGELPLGGETDEDTLNENYLDIFKYDLRKASVADELGHPILAAMTSGTPFNVRGVLSGIVEHFKGNEQEGLSRIAAAMEESYRGGDAGNATADDITTSVVSLIEERNRLKQRLQTCSDPSSPALDGGHAASEGANIPLLAALGLAAYVITKRRDSSK